MLPTFQDEKREDIEMVEEVRLCVMLGSLLYPVCYSSHSSSDWLLDSNTDILHYRNDPKFSDTQIWANSADPDQTAPEEQSDQGLHCLPFPLHLLDAVL